MKKDEELDYIFREEATEFIEAVADGVRRLSSSSGESFHASLDTVLRITHNLKGAACSTGAQSVEALAHALEGVLSREKGSEGPISRQLGDCAIDTLGMMQAALDGMGSDRQVQETLDSLAALGGETMPPSLFSTLGPELGTESQDSSRSVPAAGMVKVDPHTLDRLLGFIGEFLTFRARLMNRHSQQGDVYRRLSALQKSHAESNTDILPILTDIRRSLLVGRKDLLDFKNLIDEVNETAKQLRTVPLRGAAHVWRRIVREACRVCGKEAELEVSVGHVQIDRYVLERIQDPIMHLLRNAIDHGIEKADERIAANKPPKGRIRITASLQGAVIRLEISDDGRGVDWDKVRRKAVSRKILSEEKASALTPLELSDLLFIAGFSTSDEVSQISGRGVGLDVVRSQLEALGGRAEMDPASSSTGTVASLWVPVSILSSTGLFVRCGNVSYVLPIESVARTLRVKTDALKTVDGGSVIKTDDADPIRVISLGNVMGNPNQSSSDKVNVVVLSRGRRQLGVSVDEVSGHREYVSHALPWNLQGVDGINGAIMEADGSIAVLIDVLYLFEASHRKSSHVLSAPVQKGRKVLVVDDSLSSRAMQRAMLKADGFEVTQASDGLEAWRILQEDSFDLVVSDVQMPNMDGLELTRKIRSSFSLKDLPVILVSNLSKPEDRAAGADAGADDYLVKGMFDQQGLLSITHKYLGRP